MPCPANDLGAISPFDWIQSVACSSPVLWRMYLVDAFGHGMSRTRRRRAVPLLKHGGTEIDSIESKDNIIQSEKGRN
jgi:hypothetical protein